MNKNYGKIALGSAQWGLQYGVSNNEGQTPPAEVDEILKVAKEAGISLVDTASLYGNAEQVLGQSIISSFQVTTKTPKFFQKAVSNADAQRLIQTFYASLQRLGIESVYGLLLHDVDDLFAPGGAKLIDSLESLKSQGLISKTGVSVYTSSQIHKVLDLFKPDIIQLSINVFDQRLIVDGTVAHLSRLGIEIHARSVFLQGLLLMNVGEDIPQYFKPWIPLLSEWHRSCSDQLISPLNASLDFVCGIKDVSYVLVGVQNRHQLENILNDSSASHCFDLQKFASNDPNLIDPTTWTFGQ